MQIHAVKVRCSDMDTEHLMYILRLHYSGGFHAVFGLGCNPILSAKSRNTSLTSFPWSKSISLVLNITVWLIPSKGDLSDVFSNFFELSLFYTDARILLV